MKVVREMTLKVVNSEVRNFKRNGPTENRTKFNDIGNRDWKNATAGHISHAIVGWVGLWRLP